MQIKISLCALFLTGALCLPTKAQTYNVSEFLGTYVCNAGQSFVGIKRVNVTQDEHGKIKFHAFLAGFPDDISLGEASPESK